VSNNNSKYCWQHSKSTSQKGGNVDLTWHCINLDNPPDTRCKQKQSPGGYDSKAHCERKCVSRIKYNSEGLKKINEFIKTMKITSVIPDDFNQQLEDSNSSLAQEFEDFIYDPEKISQVPRFVLNVELNNKGDIIYTKQKILETLLENYDYCLTPDLILREFPKEMNRFLLSKIKDDDEISENMKKTVKVNKLREHIKNVESGRLESTFEYYLPFINIDQVSPLTKYSKNLEHKIHECIDKNRFIIVPLHINYLEGAPHINTLVIDKIYKKIYHFEPHIKNETVKKVSEAVKEYFHNVIKLKDYNLRSLYEDLCITEGLQGVSGDEFCQTWSLYANLLYILNPNIPRQQLFNKMLKNRKYADMYIMKFLFYIYKKFNIETMDLSGSVRYAPPGSIQIKQLKKQLELLQG